MSFLDGVLRFFGAEDDDMDDGGIVEYPVQRDEMIKREPVSPAEEQIITMPEPGQSTVYVVRPERDGKGDAHYNLTAYTEFLQSRQALIVDVNELAAVDVSEARRVIDFLAGAVKMVDGYTYEITTNVFIFTPHNVKLAGDPLKPVEV